MGGKSELNLIGQIEVLGEEIPNIEGGFDKTRKAMLAKDIADFHDRKTWRVNQTINENSDWFKTGIDVIDIKNLSDNFAHILVEGGFLTQNQVNASNNIYLLSERGYSKLIKIFDDDKSREMYDKLLDEYFEMRKFLSEKEMIRQVGIEIRKNMTDAIQESGENERMNGFAYSTYTNMIYRLVLGMTAKQYEEEHNVDNLRDHLPARQLELIKKLEGIAKYNLELGLEYSDVKETVEQAYLKSLDKLEGVGS